MLSLRPYLIQRFSDRLSAGFPSPAEGLEDPPLDIHAFLVRNAPATFLHPLRRDMPSEHLPAGSILVVDRSLDAADGLLILAELAGGFVVLRIESMRELGESYPDLCLCGVVVGAFRRIKHVRPR